MLSSSSESEIQSAERNGRVKFSDTLQQQSLAAPECNHQSSTDEPNEGETLLKPLCRLVSAERKARAITRIPTEVKLKTITHKVKRPAVDIEFHDLTYTVKTSAGSKCLLKGISGLFESGKLSAIMGPSGAGKTTLMNILIGYVNAGVKGTILTNGQPRRMQFFNKLSSYIMQEDLLQAKLTVFESMLIAAHLKLGDELDLDDKIDAVNEILKSMDLEVCRDVRTEQLSGGQRKRTSIALELVNNPPIIFLDEPTSGLDTVTTARCVDLLKGLARQGRTIVCTLHQPSSSLFHGLDHIYIVARGSCVYQGSPHQLVPFLASAGHICKSTHNPADYVLEMLTVDITRELSQEIQNGKLVRRTAVEEENLTSRKKICRMETLATLPLVYEQCNNNSNKRENDFDDESNKAPLQYPTTFSRQFSILFRRRFLQLSRDTTSMWIQLGHHLFSALLMGGIYYGVGNDASRPFDNFKFCLCVLVFFMYTYTMSPVLLFPAEIKLLEREYFNRWYGLKSYFAVTLFSSLPNIIIFGLLFQVIVYVLTDQPMELDRFILFSLVCFFSAGISEGIGVFVGSTCDQSTGSIITPALLAPVLAIAVYGMGFGTHIEPFMQYLMQISYMRYLITAMSITLYGNGRGLMKCPDIFCMYEDPELLLRDLGMNEAVPLYQFIALLIFVILFRVMSYFALRYRLNKDVSTNQVFSYMMKRVMKMRL